MTVKFLLATTLALLISKDSYVNAILFSTTIVIAFVIDDMKEQLQSG